jgi:uncharacterized membrane protein YdbT with pleckstrin-like domain/DNA-directed RNA polymerase subunit RPC12/RpoP
MNDVEFTCDHCGQRIETDEELSGRTVLCPACDERIVVPKRAIRLDPAAAMIVADAEEDRVAADDESEQIVLELRPSPRAFLGRIALAVLLPAVVLGLVMAFWPSTKGLSMQLFTVIVVLPILICAGLLLSVWVHTVSLLYTLTTERLFVRRGLLSKRIEEVELFRVKDVKVVQSALERMLGFGDVTVYSSDDSMPVFHIASVSRPVEVKEEIREFYRAARRREKVATTEFIPS